MKKLSCFSILFISFLCLIVFSVQPIKSAPLEEATSPGSTQSTKAEDQIKELRERVATKVAELSKKMLKSWSGNFKSFTSGKISLTTKEGEKIIFVDDQTKIFRIGATGKKTIETSNLVVGEDVVAIGSVNQDTGQMTAKVIIAKSLLVVINGKVTEVDKEEGTVKVQSLTRGLFVVDVEQSTKTLIWQKASGLNAGGFSKININDRVQVVGMYPLKKKEDEKRITAVRILVLPGIAFGITGGASPTASASATPKPTDKLASPTPSPKATTTP
jgi:hypothetical protein